MFAYFLKDLFSSYQTLVMYPEQLDDLRYCVVEKNNFHYKSFEVTLYCFRLSQFIVYAKRLHVFLHSVSATSFLLHLTDIAKSLINFKVN